MKQLDALCQAFGCESMLLTSKDCVFMGEHSPATPPPLMVIGCYRSLYFVVPSSRPVVVVLLVVVA